MMSEKKEALYLVDHESYLHLKETVTQTGFAYETFDKATGAAQHTGLITYEEMLENPRLRQSDGTSRDRAQR